MRVNYEYLDEFNKKLKKLLKKHKPHLAQAWEPFLKVVQNEETFQEIILRKSVNIKGTKTSAIDFFKYKDLKVLGHKNNPFRIVYFYINNTVYFVEIYEKSKQEMHSLDLIKKYSKEFS